MPTADVLPFPDPNPRCKNCVHWDHLHGPNGLCHADEGLDEPELTNSDYVCAGHVPARANQVPDNAA